MPTDGANLAGPRQWLHILIGRRDACCPSPSISGSYHDHHVNITQSPDCCSETVSLADNKLQLPAIKRKQYQKTSRCMFIISIKELFEESNQGNVMAHMPDQFINYERKTMYYSTTWYAYVKEKVH